MSGLVRSDGRPASAPTLIALIHGPDQAGLVARVAGWIYARGGNILHADQHRDSEMGVFFQRVEWTYGHAGQPLEPELEDFNVFARALGMSTKAAVSTHRPRVVLFVSKAGHCFHDLALRWHAGEYHCEIVGVVSNHAELEGAARSYALPFFHVQVAPDSKAHAEEQQLALLLDLGAELVILARYMQVLSGEFLAALGVPVINIHHSFLPAFAGGRPYHQAHARGVKLIGATAHYATSHLDEGPIIHQDVVRVTHRHGVEDLIRKGRDLEKMVLAQAVRWHLENRVLVYANKTVVFD